MGGVANRSSWTIACGSSDDSNGCSFPRILLALFVLSPFYCVAQHTYKFPGYGSRVLDSLSEHLSFKGLESCDPSATVQFYIGGLFSDFWNKNIKMANFMFR